MMSYKAFLKTLLVAGFALSLAACGDNDAEDAGEKVDEMVSDAGDAAEDAGDEMKDMAEDAGNAIEDACEDVKEGMDAEDDDC